MKKLTKLLLLAVVALGVTFTACNNEDLPQGENLKGKTYASITIKAAVEGGTRTLPDAYNKLADDWEGVDAITSVAVFLVNETLGTVDYESFKTVSDAPDVDKHFTFENGVLTPNIAVLATPGENVKAYVILNGNSDVLTSLQGKPAGTFATEYAKVVEKTASDVALNNGTNDIIMMTNDSDPTPINIKPNVTEADAKAGGVDKNRIDVSVERVVSRAIVTQAAGPHSIQIKNTANVNSAVATIQSVTYKVGQINNQFNLLKNYGATPHTDWVYDATTYAATFDNSGLDAAKAAEVLVSTGADELSKFSPQLVAEKTASKFVLPLVHAADKYQKGNSTYFEVTAVFTPDEVDGAAYTAGAEVFLGLNDGLFYSTRTLAEAGGQKAVHYKGDGTTGAIMKYVLWLNPDVIPGSGSTKTAQSPVVRNQVYHARITGFKAMGQPNNPLDPTDPSDPSNPKNPIDPEDPLETEDTYLSVQISVLKWGVHSYETELGNDY